MGRRGQLSNCCDWFSSSNATYNYSNGNCGRQIELQLLS
jgi:hypothetical protein